MRKRLLGSTSLNVSELSLGTWGLAGDGYGPVLEVDQDAVIDRALAMGIRLFETADVYGDGAMETRLGARLPKDGSVAVVTKIGTRRDTNPARKDFSVEYLREAFERSRVRLARETVDCVLLHNPSRKAFENPALKEFCDGLRTSGAVKAWGASVGDVESGRAAINAGAQVIELAYNVFHTQPLFELDGDLHEANVGVLVRSVLAHGMLCGQWPPDKQFARNDHRAERWSTDELRSRIVQLNALRPLISRDLPSLRAVALRYALAHNRTGSVVLGPKSPLQLDQLVREAGKEPPYLDSGEMATLRERLITVGVYV